MLNQDQKFKIISIKEITLNQSEPYVIPIENNIKLTNEINIFINLINDNIYSIKTDKNIDFLPVDVIGYKKKNKIISQLSLFNNTILPSPGLLGAPTLIYNGSLNLLLNKIDFCEIELELTSGYTKKINNPSLGPNNNLQPIQYQTIFKIIAIKNI